MHAAVFLDAVGKVKRMIGLRINGLHLLLPVLAHLRVEAEHILRIHDRPGVRPASLLPVTGTSQNTHWPNKHPRLCVRALASLFYIRKCV